MCYPETFKLETNFVIKKFLYNYDFVTDYVISGNDKTWPNSVSQVLFGLEKWFTHQNVCNQDILPTETIWSLINNDVSCDYIIFKKFFFFKVSHSQVIPVLQEWLVMRIRISNVKYKIK